MHQQGKFFFKTIYNARPQRQIFEMLRPMPLPPRIPLGRRILTLKTLGLVG